MGPREMRDFLLQSPYSIRTAVRFRKETRRRDREAALDKAKQSSVLNASLAVPMTPLLVFSGAPRERFVQLFLLKEVERHLVPRIDLLYDPNGQVNEQPEVRAGEQEEGLVEIGSAEADGGWGAL